MALTVDCPECQQTYSLKENHAGRRFRCKGCGHVITVPAELKSGGEAEDPWDNLDLAEMEGGDAVEEVTTVRPVAGERFRSESPGKRSRQTALPGLFGLPVAVVIAIACEGVLILFNTANIVMGMLQHTSSGACISGVRVGLEILAILGYLQGNNLARMVSMWLSALGVVLLTTCALLFIVSPQALPAEAQAQVPQGFLYLIAGLMMVEVGLFVTIIISLMMRSAVEFFD
ncbi:MAG: hypothetical protein KDA75_19400 [Planctomycetaceae bacterium]|nr:hypothetical protein [Planctomycetaceae bacterium]